MMGVPLRGVSRLPCFSFDLLSDDLCKRSNCLTITVGSKELHLWRLRLELVEWANRLPWWCSPCLQSPESWWAQVWKMILGGLFVSSICGYVYPNPEPNAQPCRFVMCFGTPFSSPRLDWQKIHQERTAWNWNCGELCCLPNAHH